MSLNRMLENHRTTGGREETERDAVNLVVHVSISVGVWQGGGGAIRVLGFRAILWFLNREYGNILCRYYQAFWFRINLLVLNS